MCSTFAVDELQGFVAKLSVKSLNLLKAFVGTCSHCERYRKYFEEGDSSCNMCGEEVGWQCGRRTGHECLLCSDTVYVHIDCFASMPRVRVPNYLCFTCKTKVKSNRFWRETYMDISDYSGAESDGQQTDSE